MFRFKKTLTLISPLYFSGKSGRVRTQFNGQSPSQEECPILCIPNAQWGFAKVPQQPKGRVGRPATRWVIIRWRWLWHTPPSLSLKRRSWQVQLIFYYSVILRSLRKFLFETQIFDRNRSKTFWFKRPCFTTYLYPKFFKLLRWITFINQNPSLFKQFFLIAKFD